MAIQEAIFELLDGKDVLILDYIPEKTSFPYVVLGKINIDHEKNKTTSGLRVIQNLDIYSGSKGKKESFMIADILSEKIREEIEIPGYYIISQAIKSLEAYQSEADYYFCSIKLELWLGEVY